MKATARTAHPICKVSELPPGSRKIVEIAGRSIGVFHVESGRYYAVRNRCPHRGAPVCEGKVIGLVTAERPYAMKREREGEILKCPWHGWEFDLATGKSVCLPETWKLNSYPAGVEPPAPEAAIEKFDVAESEGQVVVWLPANAGGAIQPT